MKSKIPWIILAAASLYTLASFVPPRHGNGINFSSIGKLPVLEGGRYKPLDTLARNSLLVIRGKQTLKVEGRRISAIEWLMDLMIRPVIADGYPVFQIHDREVLGLMNKKAEKKYFTFNNLLPYLPKIEKQSDLAERIEVPNRSRFQSAIVHLGQRLNLYQKLKNSLKHPDTVNYIYELEAYKASLVTGHEAMSAHQASLPFDQEALLSLAQFFKAYRFLSQVGHFRPIPPLTGESEDEWRNMGEGLLLATTTGEILPIIESYARLSDAYLSTDVTDINKEAENLHQTILNTGFQGRNKIQFELLFNQIQPFTLGITLYTIAFLLMCFSWLVWPKELSRSAYLILFIAFGIHTFGLLSRMILQGRPPVTNLYSSAVFIGWIAVILGIILEKLHKKGIGTIVSAVSGFLTLIIAHHMIESGDTMEMMQAVLDSNFWLGTHVVVITIGYSSTFLAGILAHVYIFRGLLTRSLHKDASQMLSQMVYGIVCFSLLFSFVGTVLGGIWADQSWGRFWGWDPKENGALLIVLWNVLILHTRMGGFIREKGLMVMAIFGNIVTSFSWFGVNMLGIGLHSYGFMDKAFSWLSSFIILELIIMMLGSLPERFWSKGVKS